MLSLLGNYYCYYIICCDCHLFSLFGTAMLSACLFFLLSIDICSSIVDDNDDDDVGGVNGAHTHMFGFSFTFSFIHHGGVGGWVRERSAQLTQAIETASNYTVFF